MKNPTDTLVGIVVAPENRNDTTHLPKRASKFIGSENPRVLRALNALLSSPTPRESLDRQAGCSNAPELVAELRRRGLDLPCTRTPCYDRDDRVVWRGVYSLTHSDRQKINRWLSQRGRV